MTVRTKLRSEQAPAIAAELAAMYDMPHPKAVGALQVNWAALATPRHLICRVHVHDGMSTMAGLCFELWTDTLGCREASFSLLCRYMQSVAFVQQGAAHSCRIHRHGWHHD